MAPLWPHRRPPRRYTPELIENGRRRYEETDESQHSIAADFGVHRKTLDRLAKEWGWTLRKDRPPRDLPPALRLHAQAEQAIVSQIETGANPEKFSPDGIESASAAANAGGVAPARVSVAEQLEREVEEQLASVRTMRAQAGPLPLGSADAERTARTLQTLTETLSKVRRLRAPATQLTGSDDFDDMRGDIDEFRRTLARRIETFVRGRTDGALPSAGESPGSGSSP